MYAPIFATTPKKNEGEKGHSLIILLSSSPLVCVRENKERAANWEGRRKKKNRAYKARPDLEAIPLGEAVTITKMASSFERGFCLKKIGFYS